MARIPLLLLPLLLLLCRLRLALGNSVVVTSTVVELQETDRSLGPELELPRRQEASIKCTVTSSGDDLTDAKVKWQRKNSSVDANEKFQVSHTLSDNKQQLESVLTIKNIDWEDIGNFSCSCCGDSATIGAGVGGFMSKPLLRLMVDGDSRQDVAVWPDESFVVTCDVGGSQPATAKWMRKKDGEGDDAFVEVTVNTTLEVLNISYPEDRGFLKCVAENSLGTNSAKLFLRVKNPKAFLLPLIILVVELCIIGLIVAAYEFYMYRKRQNERKNE